LREIKGLSTIEAVSRALELCNHYDEEPISLDGEGSIDAIQRELSAHGIDSRITQLAKGDLRLLQQLTLLELRNGGWILVLEAADDSVTAEGAAGRLRLPLGMLEREVREAAVQILRPLPMATLWRRLFWAALKERKTLRHVAVAGLLLIVLAFIAPQLTRITVDRVLPHGMTSVLGVIALAGFALTLFQGLAIWLRARAVLYVKSRMEAEVESELLVHLLDLPFRFVSGKTPGELFQAFTGAGSARRLMTEQTLGTALDGVTAIGYFVVMFTLIPRLAFVVTAFAALLSVIFAIGGRYAARAQREEIRAQAAEETFLVELLSGIAAVKAGGAEMPMFLRWANLLRRELWLRVKRQRVTLVANTTSSFFSQGLTMTILVMGGWYATRSRASLGDLLAFLQVSAGFVAAAAGVTSFYITLKTLQPQIQPAREVFSIQPETRPHQRRGRRIAGPVRMENVWFRYNGDGPWTIADFTMEVQPGEKRWLLGASGSGKSTILRLLAGLYAPDRGSITVGGRTALQGRECMIYLPQVTHVYGGSILDNLRLFSAGASRRRIVDAAEASGFSSVLSRLPLGLETVLPPGGLTLSGGERQLLIMTAVMASDRSLLLLDEAFVSIDSIARATLEHSGWFDDKTIIYATHDGFHGAFTLSSLPERPRD